MGTVTELPTVVAPPTNDTSVLWRGCWACGLILFDDEPELCTDCDHSLNSQPRPTPAKCKPLVHTLRHLGPQGLATMASAIIDADTSRAEEAAEAWARDHELDERAKAVYVAQVRVTAREQLTERCTRDLQQVGLQLGWTTP